MPRPNPDWIIKKKWFYKVAIFRDIDELNNFLKLEIEISKVESIGLDERYNPIFMVTYVTWEV